MPDKLDLGSLIKNEEQMNRGEIDDLQMEGLKGGESPPRPPLDCGCALVTPSFLVDVALCECNDNPFSHFGLSH